MEIVKEYSNREITVIWKPRKCIHSGICVQTLPRVYDPNAKPWITPEHASGKELQAQIDKCPSGALSYKLNDTSSGHEQAPVEATRVEVRPKGPLLVHGTVEVCLADGRIEHKKRSTAFCRCGASANKPYCDGSHNDSAFEG